MADDRAKLLEAAISQIEKSYGKGSIMRLGSRDVLVRSGVNGFVIEPDNPAGMAFFMKLIAEDETLWRSMSLASQQFVERADTERFADAVEELIAPPKR